MDQKIWGLAKEGKLSNEKLESLYISNLKRVLSTVQTLVQFSDVENIVLTSDHGEALGEYGVYAHPDWIDHPKVRKIPWLKVK